ncbi:hypothetical protein LTR62_000155 [Meristemomyces frigidus]|uniref:AB hydrolase-1 domain-containing protein n=1 Tax=Meristemomyces frigidus TaxID=1508187 RepID=A0AAN7TYU9_9PEZI|nr:hypothetical protein LTR62_000155 [Meristemomyces frigidus]
MPQQLTLPTGETLDYEISGVKNGFPFIWLHGTPGACTAIPSLVRACENKDLQLITFSRAGYGGSSRRKGRKVVDEAAVVQELLNKLGHERCYVGGWSGGGPHALACAARLKGYVDETNASLQGEEVLRKFVEPQRAELLAADVKGVVEVMSSILPEADRKVMLENDEVGQETVNSFREGLKNGCDGWVDDDMAFIHPWGFELSEVKCPVFMYHGETDLMVPFAHGKWIAKEIPAKHLTAHMQPGHGHISIFMGQVDSMVDELIAVGR